MEKKLICPICGQEFENTQALGSHISYKHQNIKRQKTPKLLQLYTDPQILEKRKELELARIEHELKKYQTESNTVFEKVVDLNEKILNLEKRLEILENNFYSFLNVFYKALEEKEKKNKTLASLIIADAIRRKFLK